MRSASAFLVTAYHAYDLGIMAKVAEILDKPTDAARYRGMYEKRKAFFNATFVNGEKKTLATGGGRGGFGGGPGASAATSAIPRGRHADLLRGRLGHGPVRQREPARRWSRTWPTR